MFQTRRSHHTASVPPPPPPQQPPSLEARAKEERLPESSEVVIDPRGHVAQRAACRHVSSNVTRGTRPSYAASARQVLMSSTRGLMKLRGRDSVSPSLASLYINDVFQDGHPCQAQGCPLNPRTRVSWPGPVDRH